MINTGGRIKYAKNKKRDSRNWTLEMDSILIKHFEKPTGTLLQKSMAFMKEMRSKELWDVRSYSAIVNRYYIVRKAIKSSLIVIPITL